MNREHVATMALIIRRQGHPDLRQRVVLYPDDRCGDIRRLAYRLIRRARFLDPTFDDWEMHWRVHPHTGSPVTDPPAPGVTPNRLTPQANSGTV